jgi:integrase
MDKPKGIRRQRAVLADGRVVYYHYDRATNKKIEGVPGTLEFKKSLDAIRRIERERHTAGTYAELIKKFEGSTAYAKLGAETKKEYVRKFAIVEKKWGWVPIPALTDIQFKRDVLEWHEKIAHRAPREADNLLLALARPLSWAQKKAIITVNVLDKFERAYDQPDRSDVIWLPEHVAAFTAACAAAPPRLVKTYERLYWAMMLALHTGQREHDLLDLRWSNYDGDRISLRQSKTGARVSIRCTRTLRVMLDGIERTAELILPSPRGKRWEAHNFRGRVREVREKASLPGNLHFHDLRGTAVTMLSEAGCSPQEIATITGHSLATAQRILDVYLARTRALADSAILKFEQHPRLQEQA